MADSDEAKMAELDRRVTSMEISQAAQAEANKAQGEKLDAILTVSTNTSDTVTSMKLDIGLLSSAVGYQKDKLVAHTTEIDVLQADTMHNKLIAKGGVALVVLALTGVVSLGVKLL